MPAKNPEKQSVVRRRPQQARAQNKIELILEAAMRLIESHGIDALTTNAIAERAGVSIGSLYQYFDDKEAILQALTQRELKGISERVLQNVKSAPPGGPGTRVPLIVQSVLRSYGGRRRVHRLLMERALSRGPGNRLNPLYNGLIDLFSKGGIGTEGSVAKPLKASDAFVLTHAFAGVMRAAVATENRQIPQRDLENSLTRLVISFYQSATT